MVIDCVVYLEVFFFFGEEEFVFEINIEGDVEIEFDDGSVVIDLDLDV